jgi:hypothetical protein
LYAEGGEKMSPSNKWVNPEVKAHRSRAEKKRNQANHAIPKEKTKTGKLHYRSEKAEKANGELTSQRNQDQPSLLETISTLTTLAQNIDLEKVRHQMAEVNQIVEQVNGVFQQLKRRNDPHNQNRSRQHPYYAQHPYAPQHPYHRYHQRQQ